MGTLFDNTALAFTEGPLRVLQLNLDLIGQLQGIDCIFVGAFMNGERR